MKRLPNSGVPGATDEVLDESSAEHIYLEDESGAEGARPETVAERFELRDRLRGAFTALTFYEEGFLRIEEDRRGKTARAHCIDLRYLDPVPALALQSPKRLLKIAGLCVAVGAVAALLAQVPVLGVFALATAAVAGLGALAALFMFGYASREKAVFRTLHGRAPALTLVAGLGCIRRMRAAMPRIIRAIGNAEEAIGDDTAVFLRAEMREHYRLRADGILSEEQCSDSTGRILTHFDDEM